MINLTRHALGASRLTLFTALLILLAGVATFLNFPTQEEPSVTIRDALVSIQFPGLPSERVEELLARPTEEKLRELSQIKNIVTTIHPGSAVIQVTARDEIKDLGCCGNKYAIKPPRQARTFQREHRAHLSMTISGVSLSPPLPSPRPATA